MRKVYRESRFFRVISENIVHKNMPKTRYTLSTTHDFNWSTYEAVRDITDPNRSVAGRRGKKWVYYDKSKVDKIFMWLTLKYE